MRWLTLLLLLFALNVSAHKIPPVNDDLANAINLSNTDAFCSLDQAYNNLEATSSSNGSPINWNGTVGKDVWFKFTALKFDVAITASGKVNAASPNTLVNPLVALYTVDPTTGNFGEMFSTMLSSSNVTTINKGGLTIGQVYYIRISAANNNEGSFKLCVDNYFPPLQPGQDVGTFSVLCSMEKFTQLNVTGAGTNNRETAGTCLGTESNSAWYGWTAGKSGPLTFLITPTVTTNDIDWVLYDLGPGGTSAQVTAANAIRCASGSGVTCTPSYYITGLSMTETDLTEQSGCPPNAAQNGLVRYVDMIAGHNYALLVDNFSGGNNGFSLEFGGSTEFTGPTSEIQLEKLNSCTPQQTYTFTSLATNYNTLKWTFGEGASMTTATGVGPYNITYSTSGEKTVVLEAKTAGGCNVVGTKTFFVALKPALPTISTTTIKFCPGNEVTLNTPKVDFATYYWSGPNGFTSTDQNAKVNITGPENSGDYQLYIQVGDCLSDVATINIPSIDPKPEALFDIVTNNFCQNNLSFTFKNTSLNSINPVWDFGSGATVTTAPNGDKTVTYLTDGTKNITLTVSSPSGCVSTITKTLLVEFRPAAPIITTNGTKFCPGDVLQLNTTTVNLATYNWSGPNGFNSTLQNPQLNITGPENAGDYKLFIQVGSCSSDVVIFKLPIVDAKPEALFDILVNNPCLANQSFTFVNKSLNTTISDWDFGSGVSFKTQAANGNFTVFYTTAGLKTITLIAKTPNGCPATIIKTIDVQLKPQRPEITANQTKFCLGDMLRFSVQEFEGLTYEWVGPNGFTAATSSIEIPINSFDQAGTYFISTKIGDCKSDVVSIKIPPIAKVPVAIFYTDPKITGKYEAPLPIAFSNYSKDADNYLWDFGDGTTSTATNPTHTFTQNGVYKITLTAFAEEGCSHSLTMGDLILKDASLFVPNAFSPNGDGVNDVLKVTILNLKKYQLFIYNRFGENVFQTTDIFNNWDGKYKNKDVSVGTYYYVIMGKTVGEKDVKYTGSVTLIR
ncbi:MAG: PKD domain-containing protein [Pedobacter sp.]|nr:MAG: PKD domain-containing protein [Pedobacter sp.]